MVMSLFVVVLLVCGCLTRELRLNAVGKVGELKLNDDGLVLEVRRLCLCAAYVCARVCGLSVRTGKKERACNQSE